MAETPSTMSRKPHIYLTRQRSMFVEGQPKYGEKVWTCVGMRGGTLLPGRGDTPMAAYEAWKRRIQRL